MSRIEEFIKQMCPDGIEYISIGEAFDVITDYTAAGSFADLAKNVVYNDSPDYAQLVRTMDIKSKFTKGASVYVSENAFKYLWRVNLDSEAVILPNIGVNCGEIYYLVPENLPYENNVLGPNAIMARSTKNNNKYLFYVLQTSEFQKQLRKIISPAGQTKFNKTELKKLQIPVPPIEVQQEIVRILDKFAELEAGLRAELETRKKQYEYYKMNLLSFDENVPVKELQKTCNMKAGKAISASNISESKNEVQKYACFGGNGVRGYVEFQNYKGEYPIIGRQGALCGNVNYATGNFYATEHAVVVASLGEYTQRFLYHLLVAMNLNQYKSQGAQPGLAVGNIGKLLAPVPTIEQQEKITTILDTFEMICNDCSQGLPAEIEARHKQYEYYRDKLLTFKRKVV